MKFLKFDEVNKIILGAVIFGLVVLSIAFYHEIQVNKELNINGLEIPAKTFGDISDAIGEGNFIICDIDEDECFMFNKKIVPG